MGTKQKAEIEKLAGEKIALEQKVELLTTQITTLESNHKTAIELKDQEWELKLNTQKTESDEKISERDEEIEELKEENAEKQSAIDIKEAKKLAKAYEDQEIIYQKGSEKWLNWLMKVAGVLVISTGISIWLSADKLWYDKFEYYVIDLIFISAVWFCGSQYSDQVKLRDDYANRKTLAQSFHNILNNLPEDEAIKSKYIEKATDVLCAPSPVTNKEPVLSKKIIKDTAEIVSAIKR